MDMQKACKITQLEAVIRFPEAMAEGLPFPAMDSPYCKLHGCEKLLPLLERISYFHRAGELSEADQVQLDFGLLELYAMLSEELQGSAAEQKIVKRRWDRSGRSSATSMKTWTRS